MDLRESTRIQGAPRAGVDTLPVSSVGGSEPLCMGHALLPHIIQEDPRVVVDAPELEAQPTLSALQECVFCPRGALWMFAGRPYP